jgi:hypothetical protein
VFFFETTSTKKQLNYEFAFLENSGDIIGGWFYESIESIFQAQLDASTTLSTAPKE